MVRTNQVFLDYFQDWIKSSAISSEQAKIKRYSKGEKLLIQQSRAHQVMIILEGCTKCFFCEDNDKEFIVEFLGQGEIIGEIEFLRSNPCLCHVEALTPVSVFSMSYSFFSTLLQQDLKFNHLLLSVFADRIIQTSRRASFQQVYSFEHSLVRLLQFQETQGLSLSKEDMASYLGITVRILNRVLRKIEKGV